jgi:hypothetical protein
MPSEAEALLERPAARPAGAAGPGRTELCGSTREPLSQEAVRMVLTLRPRASLVQTAALFPHVANRLAAVIDEPGRAIRLIDALILDDRSRRIGFPVVVLAELDGMRERLQADQQAPAGWSWSLGFGRRQR